MSHTKAFFTLDTTVSPSLNGYSIFAELNDGILSLNLRVPCAITLILSKLFEKDVFRVLRILPEPSYIHSDILSA